ncbi:MAG TPA: ferritin family protein [Bacteroidota bacterium]|nr:ferritin family protein [Bacteroidota bacterium]
MKSRIFITALLALVMFTAAAAAKDQTKTIANIKAAIKGETTASMKYAAYAEKAKKEGYAKIALLFEAASKAEKIHATNHRAVLEQLGAVMDEIKPEFTVKSTAENLEDASKGEAYEISTMYPGFIKQAQTDGVNLALISFNYAYQTEKKHLALYRNAADQLKAKKENTLPSKYMVCQTCGNTYDGEAPARCGISMTPKERFITIGA